MHNDSLDELKEEVKQVKNAIFGDPGHIKDQPGMIAELLQVQRSITSTNTTLKGLRDDIKKAVWLVVSAVIIGTLSFTFRLNTLDISIADAMQLPPPQQTTTTTKKP